VRSDAEDVYAAGGVLDDEEDVQPVQGHGVEVEQTAGEDAVCLRWQEFGPRGSGAAG
jgi:hypothetical protein